MTHLHVARPAPTHHLPAPELPLWLARELPFARYRIDVGGPQMHVMEIGDGRPVLMLHGNPTWGFLYRKVAAALQGEKLRLIAPDLVGFGFSDKPRDAGLHTLDNHCRWVAALVESLDLHDVILVVQDWGGNIGVCGVAERIAGLVVLNTTLSPPKAGFRPTSFHRFAATPLMSDIAFRLLGFPQRGLSLAQGDRRSIRGSTARAYRYPLRRLLHNAAPLAMARAVPSSMDHPSIPRMRECESIVRAFEGPAAIVWGDRDPILGSVRNWISQLLPQASVTRTEAGHFVPEEAPEPIAAAICEVAAAL